MDADLKIDAIIKLVTVGDSHVGKTSLLVRYTDDFFGDPYYCTIGIDFKIKLISIEDKTIKQQIWDIAGAERYRPLTGSFCRGAKGVFVIYDVTSRNSFEHVRYWIDAFNQHSTTNSKIMLVGNKIDLESQRCVSFEEGQQLATEIGALFIETSAKTSINVHLAYELLTQAIFQETSITPVVSLKDHSVPKKFCIS